jgi:hypothetical protein
VRVKLFAATDGKAELTVEDDSPNGFADLRDSYTLFAESKKKGDPNKRGRFNLGEKRVIAVSDEVEIVSTRGGIRFDADGRHMLATTRCCGTSFWARFSSTQQEIDHMLASVRRMVPPPGIRTFVNDELLAERSPTVIFTEVLATEIAKDDGRLVPTRRRTDVRIYEPLPGEPPALYEMGIPVVNVDMPWHVDVGQKVPLNTDRDNVTPAYLRHLRGSVLNHTAGLLTGDEAAEPWVADALKGDRLDVDAIRKVLAARYGERFVTADPSDTEATKRAHAAGFSVIHGGSFPKQAWINIKAAGLAQPAGQLFPTPKPFDDGGDQALTMPDTEWTPGIRSTVELFKRVASALLGAGIDVTIVDDPAVKPWYACYGGEGLFLNFRKLGVEWFDDVASKEQLALLLHELAHHYEPDHLSDNFADTIAELGAALARASADGDPLAIRRMAALPAEIDSPTAA